MSSEKAGPFNKYLCQSEFEPESLKNSEITFTKNQMTGRFEMGSTIVLILEADANT